MATPLLGTEASADKLKRVRYTHDAMIDMILINPQISQNELALTFGFSVPWISNVMNSDAFQARLAERKTELVDPIVVKELNDRMDKLAHISLSVVEERIIATKDPKLALATLELTTRALGFGARKENPVINNQFVVALPAQAPTAQAWAQAHSPQVIDVPVKEASGG